MGKAADSAAARKQFLRLAGTPVIIRTVRQVVEAQTIDEILIAVRDEDRATLEELLAQERLPKPVRLAAGGRTRQESVLNCLAMVAPDVELVAVHDAVRPFIEPELIDQAVRQAARDGAVILGLPAVETVKQVDQRIVHATLPRERIMLAQTPQVFRTELLKRAYEQAERDGFTGTDEASLVEHLGEDVHVMMGSQRNIKITKPGDLALAEFLLQHLTEAPATADAR